MPMFDQNEFIAEASFRDEIRRAKISADAESGIWTMKNGDRIAVTDMTDSHLLNTYRMLERNNVMDLYISWLAVLQKEIVKRKLNYEFKEMFF